MTITELLAAEAGTKGVSIDGQLAAVWPPKQGPYGPSQFMLLTDGIATVAVQSKTSAFEETDKGKMVSIEGASWRSYVTKGVTKFVLDVAKGKSARISLSGDAAPATATPVAAVASKPLANIEDVKEEILKEYKESLIKAMELLGDGIVSEMLAVCKEKGWESKDVTAVAASIWIELNKKRHIADMRR